MAHYSLRKFVEDRKKMYGEPVTRSDPGKGPTVMPHGRASDMAIKVKEETEQAISDALAPVGGDYVNSDDFMPTLSEKAIMSIPMTDPLEIAKMGYRRLSFNLALRQAIWLKSIRPNIGRHNDGNTAAWNAVFLLANEFGKRFIKDFDK